jgi:NAD(P)-dependent dehydrogenase (short-subunit alcohol dehydrogenase family)
VDGIEETMQVCHLSHLLLCRELLPKLKISRGRIVFLTTQTHSPNSLPGKIPPHARLGDLSGLAAGLGPRTTGMVDSGPFEPTKAYKDAKAANVLSMKALSDRYGRDGVTSVAIFRDVSPTATSSAKSVAGSATYSSRFFRSTSLGNTFRMTRPAAV